MGLKLPLCFLLDSLLSVVLSFYHSVFALIKAFMSNFETILEIIRKKVTIYYIYWNPYIAEKGHFCFDRIPLK